MKNRRLFLLPVISFTLIIAFRIFFVVSTIYALNKMGDSVNAAAVKKGLLNFWFLFWPCLVIAEIVIYCIIRKRLYKRQWVFIHSLCNLLVFVVLPLSTSLFALLFAAQYPPAEFAQL